VMDKAQRSGDSTEIDEYGVQEEAATNYAPGVRSFLLLNDGDAAQPDVYRCVVGEKAASCTCKAGTTGNQNCKHISACRKLCDEKLL
jgi:hypothetical protein